MLKSNNYDIYTSLLRKLTLFVLGTNESSVKAVMLASLIVVAVHDKHGGSSNAADIDEKQGISARRPAGDEQQPEVSQLLLNVIIYLFL
jgi:hypothetical protein